MAKVVKLIEALAVSGLAIFAPIRTIALVTLVMIFVDLFTGVVAAYRRKEPITSAGFRRTVSKIFVYEVALGAGFLAQHYMIQDLELVKMISGMVAVVELKSIMENLDSISGTSLMQTLIDKLGSKNPS